MFFKNCKPFAYFFSFYQYYGYKQKEENKDESNVNCP